MMLRLIGALIALVEAALHLWQYFAGFHGTGVAVPFLINVVAGVVIAILLVTWKNWVPAFLLFGLGLATLVGFAIAATWGLFGIHERWSLFPQWLTAIVDVIAIVLGIVIAAQQGIFRRGHATEQA